MCRLYVEASKILAKASQGHSDENQATVRQLLLEDKTCIHKKRKQLQGLVLKTMTNVNQLVSKLETIKVNPLWIENRTEEFWLRAVLLQHFMGRRTLQRLQPDCPYHSLEKKLMKLGFTMEDNSTETELVVHQKIDNTEPQEETVDNCESAVKRKLNDNDDATSCDHGEPEKKRSKREPLLFDYLRFVNGHEGNEVSSTKLIRKTLGLKRVKINFENHQDLISAMKLLKSDEFIKDPILKRFFIFPQSARVKSSKMFKSGQLYSQDRASALAAHVLNPELDSVVLDACAAPGSKSFYIADAILQRTGKVIAVDRDSSRLETMKNMLKDKNLSNIEYIRDDFIKLDPSEPRFASVRYILVDPSCSGTGMTGSRGFTFDNKPISEKRLKSIQGFQIMMLRQAMMFPSVECIVYSTCSIKVEENEAVVSDVLAKPACSGWQLETLPENYSSSRGNTDLFPTIGPHCLRFWDAKDYTNGFFVCKLIRKKL